MVELQTGWQGNIDKAHGSDPFIWLFTIPLHVSGSLNLVARLTTYNELVSITGLDWYPWPIEVSAIEESPEDLPAITLSLANDGNLLTPYLEDPADARGLMGRNVQVALTTTADTSRQYVQGLRIAGAQVDQDVVALRLEPPNYFARQIPQRRYNARRCRHVFGSEQCGYVINGAAAFTDCPKTLGACRARGDDMAARNLGRPQPQNFGGFPGLLEQ